MSIGRPALLHLWLLGGLLMVAAPGPARGQADLDVDVQVRAPVAKFTTDLANGGKNCSSVGVECVGEDVSCSNSALSLAGQAIQLNEIKNAAWSAAATTFSVSKDVLSAAFPELNLALELGEFLKAYLESDTYAQVWRNMGQAAVGSGEWETASELFGQKVAVFVYDQVVPEPGEPDYVDGTYDHSGCGEVYVAHSIRALDDGRLRMTIVASGDCGERWPTHPRALGEWTVLGGLNLAPEVEADGSSAEIVYRASSDPEYRVEASCP